MNRRMHGTYGQPKQVGPAGVSRRDLGAPPRRGAGKPPRGYRRSDVSVLEDICERLMLEEGLDVSDVEVTVDIGYVILSGMVPERWMRRRIEEVVDEVSGVIDIEDRLEVPSGDTRRGPAGRRQGPPDQLYPYPR